LDQRNASLALMPSSAAVAVQVLLELKGRGELGVLVTSREGMGRPALKHARKCAPSAIVTLRD